MSEPSYRIETTFEVDPNFPNIPWTATILSLTDEEAKPVRVYGSTEESAFAKARETVRQLARGPQPGGTYYMNEDGDAMTPEAIDAETKPERQQGKSILQVAAEITEP